MFKNCTDSKFRRRALPILIVGVLVYYIYCAVAGEQISVLTSFVTADTGWTASQMLQPITYGSLVAVAITYFINTLFMKTDSKIVLVSGCVLTALTFVTVGLAVGSKNYIMVFVSLLIMRSVAPFLSQSINYMCTNWFSRHRGKALGIVTIGGPLCSACFMAISSAGYRSAGFTTTWCVVGAFCLIVGVLTIAFYRTSPKAFGMHADGAATDPIMEDAAKPASVGTILKQANTWKLIVSFGILQFGVAVITGFFVTVLMIRGLTDTQYLPALTISAVLGIPISYILGVLDDRLGTIKASLCMIVLFVICYIGMAIAAPGNMIGLILATVGMAGLAGGLPNLQVSVNFHVYGREDFLSANRILLAAQGIIGAFAGMFMAHFLDAGQLVAPYIILLVITAVAFVILCTMIKVPDHDRALEDAGK